jgi:excinuclease UvrABC nuclease subunit
MSSIKYREEHRKELSEAQQRYYAENRAARLEYAKTWRAARLRPCVYVLVNESGEVIYVGRANHLANRMSVHKLMSPWWSEVAKVKSRWRSSFADAMVLEALLIRKYLPRYNQDGVTK